MPFDLCLHTDSVASLTFEEALDFAADSGISAVEVAAGGQSRAPHMRIHDLLDSASACEAFSNQIASRSLRLAAINCSAWPMHPVYGAKHLEFMTAAIRLAGELQTEKIVAMSGCPGDSPRTQTVNWLGFPWPEEAHALREAQWQLAVETWGTLADAARMSGVKRIALELLPPHLVYNVPTLLRLRTEIGPIIGANVDPSHLFWQQMDPVEVVAALGDAVHHVHLKDLQLNRRQLSLTGVLDPRPLDDSDNRSWIFRTVGRGHPAPFWKAFIEELSGTGYEDVLSIENEDPLLPGEAGVAEAQQFISSVLADTH
jgi:sugar phosphate isomerase/epimerase